MSVHFGWQAAAKSSRMPYRALQSIAQVARDRRDGPLGQGLRDEFKARGLDYRGGISETSSRKIREQHLFAVAGREFCCEEHICLGGGTYDPAKCLRIYMS